MITTINLCCCCGLTAINIFVFYIIKTRLSDYFSAHFPLSPYYITISETTNRLAVLFGNVDILHQSLREEQCCRDFGGIISFELSCLQIFVVWQKKRGLFCMFFGCFFLGYLCGKSFQTVQLKAQPKSHSSPII